MRTTRTAVAILLLGGLPVALAVPASAHKAKRYDDGVTSEKHHQHHHHRERTKVRVRAPYTAVDVDTTRRRVHIRVPYYNRVIRW
jgi:hypothetical protein